VTIQIMRAQGRARSGELEQPVGRQDRDFGGQRLSLGHCDRSGGDAILVRLGDRGVNESPGALEQSLRRVQTDLQITDLGDRMHVLVAVILAAVDPWPRMAAYEINRIGDSGLRNAGVEGGLDDLAYGTVSGRLVVGAMEIGRA